MIIDIDSIEAPTGDRLDVEIVERKGLGHPDSICDAIAEELSLKLCRAYIDAFGHVLHHNVDKVLLWGGAAEPRFGGGKVLRPIEIYIAGRASEADRVQVDGLALDAAREWFAANVPSISPNDFRIHSLVRSGSSELRDVFARHAPQEIPRANDTSCGIGYAPLSRLEMLVLRLERHLTHPETRRRHPSFGADVKVMGVSRRGHIRLTVACALIDRFISGLDAYQEQKAALAGVIRRFAAASGSSEVDVDVNAADDPARGSIYLTVTGTSAEAGDDGGAGRGNRVNGLIAPLRPMTMESVAGKNPINHVGKLYNIAAGLIADRIVREVAEVSEAHCLLVSRIGAPITDPQVAQLRIRSATGIGDRALRSRLEAVVQDVLSALPSLFVQIMTRAIGLDRWPLDVGIG